MKDIVYIEMEPATNLVDKMLAINGVTNTKANEVAAGNPGAATAIIAVNQLYPDKLDALLDYCIKEKITGSDLHVEFKDKCKFDVSKLVERLI